MFKRRIVVTGIGACTPLGLNVHALYDKLIRGKDAIKDVRKKYNELSSCKCRAGSYFTEEQLELGNLGIADIPHVKNRTAHFTRLALSATREAIENSGIFNSNDSEEIREKMGVSIAGGLGGSREIERAARTVQTKGYHKIEKFYSTITPPSAATSFIGTLYRLRAGFFSSPGTTCTSGLVSFINGFNDIREGRADAYICGGTTDFSPLTFAGFNVLGKNGALSKNKNIHEASRPFDKDRDGFVLGEGAGIAILEELKHAKKRGAQIYAEIIGYGANSDGEHLTSPRPDAKYQSKAILDAMKMGHLSANQIDYINAHGTSTELNGPTESLGIKNALGSYANNPHVNSTKSMTGHLLSGAGALEIAVTLETMRRGIIHPTKNLFNPDIRNECTLNYAKDGNPVEREIKHALSLSLAFGGRNTAILFKK